MASGSTFPGAWSIGGTIIYNPASRSPCLSRTPRSQSIAALASSPPWLTSSPRSPLVCRSWSRRCVCCTQSFSEFPFFLLCSSPVLPLQSQALSGNQKQRRARYPPQSRGFSPPKNEFLSALSFNLIDLKIKFQVCNILSDSCSCIFLVQTWERTALFSCSIVSTSYPLEKGVSAGVFRCTVAQNCCSSKLCLFSIVADLGISS